MPYNTLGTNILWGVNSTVATLTGLGALTLLESRDHSAEADKDEVRDVNGNVKTVTYYNKRDTASLRFAVAQTYVSFLPSIGATLAITDAAYVPMGQTWIVDKVATQATNTKALMATLDLIRYTDGAVPN